MIQQTFNLQTFKNILIKLTQGYIHVNIILILELLQNLIIDMIKIDPKLRINEDQIEIRLNEVLAFHS